MTKAEIVRSYRESKYKNQQIKIISQLACKPVEEIERILVDAGETLPTRKKSTKPKTAPKDSETKDAEIKVERSEKGIIPTEESGSKFFEALEKDCESVKTEKQPRKFKEDIPQTIKDTIFEKIRQLDAQMEEIQRKKAEMIDFILEKDT